MNADLRLQRPAADLEAAHLEAAEELRRTLASPRASRRDVLAAVQQVPGFADRLVALQLPVRRDRGRRRPLENVVAILGHERLRRLLELHLSPEEPSPRRATGGGPTGGRSSDRAADPRRACDAA
jgi:hypothetical protein